MKFYQLGYDDDNYEPAEEVSERDKIVGWCPIYGRKHPAILKMKEGEESILTIDLPSPNIGDFIRLWGEYKFMITENVAELFKKTGFTGYELKPVRINKIKRMRKPKSIPNLWELVITGFAGISPPESGIKMIYKCDMCNLIKYAGCTNKSALIDISQWDSSDFFFIYPVTNFVFITERVKNFIEENKLSACKVIPLEEVTTKYIEDDFCGGDLYREMPIDRAKAFGEPLGIYVDPNELWERAIQLDNQKWPDGLGSGDNEWDKEWRDFLKAYMREGKGILSKDVLLEQLDKMLRKYPIVQAIEDIDNKINELKKLTI